jgi:hypothetical protein
VTETCRSDARSVILRLRRYRDRVQGIVSAVTGESAADGRGAIVLQRQIRSLKSDLDNEAHECTIHRRRMVQTECEHEFLWPAMREAANAIGQRPGATPVDACLRAELSTAQTRIQCYLTQLEGRWPTL